MAVVFIGEIRNRQKVLFRKFNEKRCLGGCRHTWENSTDMGLKEVGYTDVDWNQPAQHRTQ